MCFELDSLPPIPPIGLAGAIGDGRFDSALGPQASLGRRRYSASLDAASARSGMLS